VAKHKGWFAAPAAMSAAEALIGSRKYTAQTKLHRSSHTIHTKAAAYIVDGAAFIGGGRLVTPWV